MWDFDFGKSLALAARTLPFIVLRVAVFFGIGLGYLLAIGVGAVFGLVFGGFFSPDPFGGALIGGAIGFGLSSLALYLAREYLLYLVKAAHIAVLVELYDGHTVPSGQNQLSFGAGFVKTHFATASVLFGVDQLIKAVIRTIFGTVNFFTAFVPLPGVQNLIRLAEGVVRLSLTYVDEIILAYLIRTRTTNPWDTAKNGLILYAQNYTRFLKNALWLAVFLWVLTAAIFILLLGPAAGLVAFLPGTLSLWGFALAALMAWGIKAALLEPVAIACLMQVYFKTIEGQTPDPEWAARLDGASRKFRDLTDRASTWVAPSGSASGQKPA
jgi:hypothetical protein